MSRYQNKRGSKSFFRPDLSLMMREEGKSNPTLYLIPERFSEFKERKMAQMRLVISIKVYIRFLLERRGEKKPYFYPLLAPQYPLPLKG
jgi:hypothetical protein